MLGSAHNESRGRIVAIDRDIEMRIVNAIALDTARERFQHNATLRPRSIGTRRKLIGLARRRLKKLRALNNLIDETPLDCALAAHTFFGGAEKIRAIAAHSALVDQPREASGARQHRQ